jgi:hypothetical protein
MVAFPVIQVRSRRDFQLSFKHSSCMYCCCTGRISNTPHGPARV